MAKREVINNELHIAYLVYRAPADIFDDNGYCVIAGYRHNDTKEYSDIAINKLGIPFERHGQIEKGQFIERGWKRLSLEDFTNELTSYRLAVQGTSVDTWNKIYESALKNAVLAYNIYPERQLVEAYGSSSCYELDKFEVEVKRNVENMKSSVLPKTEVVYAEKKNSHSVKITRSSVSMGDDCMAPHESELNYDDKMRLSDLLDEVADYVPQMRNVIWTVRNDIDELDEITDIAQLIFDEDTNYTKKLLAPNERIINMNLGELFCIHEGFKPGEVELPEAKKPGDMISDGVLAYGVDVGRFVFHKGRITVYAILDLQHIGPSDVMMIYQISKEDYKKLLSLSRVGRIPSSPVPRNMIDACKKNFLCGESSYCARYQCTLVDVDMSLVDKNLNVV